MDNASKALIMAGAILISIAIVGVGVFIFSSTSSVQNTVNQQMDATAASTTNSTFRRYTGSRVKGSTVKDFVEYVKVINTNEALPKAMTMTYGSSNPLTMDTSTLDSTFKSNSYYSVEIKDNDNDGYYDTVTITDYSAKS